MFAFRLAELARELDAELQGDGSIIITGVASIGSAQSGQITFLTDSRYHERLVSCMASAVILTAEDLPYCSVAALVVNNVYLAYARLAQLLDTTPPPATNIAESAVIAPNVQLGRQVAIGANAVIEEGCILGDNVMIGAGCFIGKNVSIGANTRLWANVSIYHDVVIGQDCLIQSNTVIGSDGFGYANERGCWVKIPQLGTVRIGDKVEIGACTAIDRGALDDTLIGEGVIIDNQCQIAHNVIIGDHTAVAGGVIMAGSLKIGRHCQIGGGSVLNGHMEICNNVSITGMSMVMRPITEPGVYSSGIPLQPNKVWRKTAALVMKIDEINKRLKAVECEVNKNESAK